MFYCGFVYNYEMETLIAIIAPASETKNYYKLRSFIQL